MGGNPLYWIDPLGLAPNLWFGWYKPKPWSKEQCAKLRDDIYHKNDILRDEFSRYDPYLDGAGGWPMPNGETIPGGHYIEIKNAQRGLKKDLENYNKHCRNNDDDNPPITRNCDEIANQDVPVPIDPLTGPFDPMFLPFGTSMPPSGGTTKIKVRIPVTVPIY